LALLPLHPSAPCLGSKKGRPSTSLFFDVLLTLDYPASRVRIERAGLPESDGTDILPLEAHSTRLAFVELSAEGDTFSALFDTGNLAAPFYLPRSIAVRLEWAFSRVIIGGQAMSGYAVSIDQKNRRLRLKQ